MATRARSDGVQPLRLSDSDLARTHPSLLDPFTAEATNGVRLRWCSPAKRIRLDVSPLESARTARAHRAGMMVGPTVDIRIGSELVDRRVLPSERSVLDITAPGGDNPVEVWLPHTVGVVIHHLAADVPLEPAPDARPRWIIYGSSITHDALAPGPSQTWPAELARARGWHLTSLGFRGDCHLDPMVARAIGRHTVDRITVELGINVHNHQSMRERAFRPAAHNFIETLREGNDSAQLEVVSPVYGAERETEHWSHDREGRRLDGDLTLPLIRSVLREAVEHRQRSGDRRIRYIDGLALLGPDDAGLFFDGLHPDRSGATLMGERLRALLGDGLGASDADHVPLEPQRITEVGIEEYRTGCDGRREITERRRPHGDVT